MEVNILNRIRKYFSVKERQMRQYEKLVPLINSLEPEMIKMSDDDLSLSARVIKREYNKNQHTEYMVRAFAIVREASKRTIKLRHHDVQLIGGAILFDGAIAEMYTGEGKTIVATLAAFMNHVTGIRTYISTVNDYLVQRDATTLQPLYNFLGMEVGYVLASHSGHERASSYSKDVVYMTTSELAFDFLRDNTMNSVDRQVVVPYFLNKLYNTALIVDEVDMVLLDGAKTPYILSGPGEFASENYNIITPLLAVLKSGIDYTKEPDSKDCTLTDIGCQKVDSILQRANIIKGSLWEDQNRYFRKYVDNALNAHFSFIKGDDYIVDNLGNVLLINPLNGRTEPGKRLSDGLHQAIEAKEGVEVRNESKTLAETNAASLVKNAIKLSGMTGTARSNEQEFEHFYNLSVYSVPTNKPIKKIWHPDRIFLTDRERNRYALKFIKERHAKGQPILIICPTLQKSEDFSSLLKQNNLSHELLNAKNHKREAEIIEMAGKIGKITTSTPMAGRGTDIALGGRLSTLIRKALEEKEEGEISIIIEKHAAEKSLIEDLGGLLVICLGRNESRSVDDQSTGRCARQGERGECLFFLSLEDELFDGILDGSLQAFALQSAVAEAGEEGFSDYFLDKTIKKIQEMKTAYSFDMRKQQNQYDEVRNQARVQLYKQRNNVLRSDNMLKPLNAIFNDVINRLMKQDHIIKEKYLKDIKREYGKNISKTEQINLVEERMQKGLTGIFGTNDPVVITGILNRIQEKALRNISSSSLNEKLRSTVLYVLDSIWRDYLEELNERRRGIVLSTYANKEPLHEYKEVAYQLFQQTLLDFKIELVREICHTKFVDGDQEHTSEENTREDYFSKKNFKGNMEKMDLNQAMDQIKMMSPKDLQDMLRNTEAMMKKMGANMNIDQIMDQISKIDPKTLQDMMKNINLEKLMETIPQQNNMENLGDMLKDIDIGKILDSISPEQKKRMMDQMMKEGSSKMLEKMMSKIPQDQQQRIIKEAMKEMNKNKKE